MIRTPLSVLLGAAVLALGLAACDVDVEDRGELPDVDVKGDPGKLPKYEVRQTEEGRAPDVDVDVQGGRAPDVDVRGPDVDIDRETIEVPVPEIEVRPPPEDDVQPRQ